MPDRKEHKRKQNKAKEGTRTKEEEQAKWKLKNAELPAMCLPANYYECASKTCKTQNYNSNGVYCIQIELCC